MKKIIITCLIFFCTTTVWGQSTFNTRQVRTTQEVTSIVSGVTLSDSDYSKIVSIGVSGGTNTVTLPTTTFNGASFTLEVSGNGTVRIIPPATATIENGDAGQYLYTNGATTPTNRSVTLEYNKGASNWGVRNPLGSWTTTSVGDIDKTTIAGGTPWKIGTNGAITSQSDVRVNGTLGTTSSSAALILFNRDLDGRNWQYSNHDQEISLWSADSGTTMTIDPSGNAWFILNVSALSYTDRTPYYTGDALKEIKAIRGHGKEIDHSTLPTFVQSKHKRNIYKEELVKDSFGNTIVKKTKTGEEEIQGRDLGAMISVLTVAVQQLNTKIETLEAELAKAKK